MSDLTTLKSLLERVEKATGLTSPSPEAVQVIYWALSLLMAIGVWAFLSRCPKIRLWLFGTKKPTSGPAQNQHADGPDMTIRDLFFYLDTDVMDEPRWLAVGQVVRDHMALGRLRCWGRPVRDDEWVEDLVGNPVRPAPDKISKTYWQRAQFTYLFLSDDPIAGAAPHTSPDLNSGLPVYRDLKVSKAQAMSLDWSDIPKFRAKNEVYFADRRDREGEE